MKVKFINAETNEEMPGTYFVENGEVWSCIFDSCDKQPNPTRAWNGYSSKVTHPVRVEVENDSYIPL